jgi:hypothetical protein
MAFLREIATDRMVPLEPEHVVGRALTCSLRIDHRYVSSQHAMIRHDGDDWVIRDLASRNGTWIDGERIAPGQEQRLGKGSRLAFGVPAAQWEMADDAPPGVMAVPLDGTAPVIIEGTLSGLPSAEDPRATVYRDVAGSWMLEEGEAPAVPLTNLRVFHCAGRAWRFSCPSNVRATTRADNAPEAVHVRELAFEFCVSLDEEHVDLRARCGDRLLALGERAHHYLLLTLARARMADAQTETVESACGWLDVETLCRGSKGTRGQISVDVFRARKQLQDHGIVDAARIIERRPGQLRIGTPNLTIGRH